MKKHNCSIKNRPSTKGNGEGKKQRQKLKNYRQGVPKNTQNQQNAFAYDNLNYIEDMEMRNNIDDIVKNKINMKYKAKKAVPGVRKKKHKRSATPALAINY